MSAIQIAAEAIAAMKLGRLDAETTANLGVIQGGLADQHRARARSMVRGETRSLSLEKLEAQTAAHAALLRRGGRAATRCGWATGATRRASRPRSSASTRGSTSATTRRSSAWCRPRPRAIGRTCRTRGTGGGSDANVFAERGLEVANLACGMREIHTVNEWVDVRDLVLTAGLVVETVRLNAAA